MRRLWFFFFLLVSHPFGSPSADDCFSPWIRLHYRWLCGYGSIDWMVEAMAGTLETVGSRWACFLFFYCFRRTGINECNEWASVIREFRVISKVINCSNTMNP